MAAPQPALRSWLSAEQQIKCQKHVTGDARALCDGAMITRIQTNLATISEKIAAYTRAYDEVYALADQLTAELQRIITKADVDIAAMQARLAAGIALSPAEKQKLEQRLGTIERDLATTVEARDIYKDLLEQLATRLRVLDTQAQGLSKPPFTAKSLEPFQGVLKTAQGWGAREAAAPGPPAPEVTAQMIEQLAQMEGVEPTPALAPSPPPVTFGRPPGKRIVPEATAEGLKPTVKKGAALQRGLKQVAEQREKEIEERRRKGEEEF